MLYIYLFPNMTHCLTCFFQDTLDKVLSPEELLLVSMVLEALWLLLLLFKLSCLPLSAPVVSVLSSFSSPAVSRLPLCLKDGNISIQDFLSNKSQKSEDFWFILDIITKFKNGEKLPSSYI